MDSIVQVRVEKLVHGGQGIGELADGRKCFVWGGLPSELVSVRLTKKKRDWAEGVVVEVLEASSDRINPREPEMYLATSPWQVLKYDKEAEYKQSILAETFAREHIEVSWSSFYQDGREFGYRNKMEYNFWFHNDTGQVDIALHSRGSHQKVAVKGSALASDFINDASRMLVDYINQKSIGARRLKSVIIRSSQSGDVGVSLFVTDKSVINELKDFKHAYSQFEIIFSNPKSPASVTTEILIQQGDGYLSDSLLERIFNYSTRSFFQVNIPVYEAALQEIATYAREHNQRKLIDLYSGVGSIGLSVVGDNQKLIMIETERESTLQAELNSNGRKDCEVITATAESALQYLRGDEIVIVDPPRAGLHNDVTEKLCESKPPRIIYLSCNPSTQARDVKLLMDAGYEIMQARGYNFFPRTPHIESLVVLDKVQ
jgi:23S rRNA (uracil1939-C5)-methyltransferase